MGFGEDLRGELFGKLGVESGEDPLKLIEKGIAEKSQGNNQGAKKSFEKAQEIASNQAAKFTGQSQHRAAAEAYYIQSMAEGHLGNSDKQSQIFKEVIDRLLEAGKSAVAFGENQRGMAMATLAGMVSLMDSDETKAKQIYSEYMEISQQKEDGAHLQKLLYALGYLLDALENDNVGAIADAENYISTDLRPMLSTAKLGGFTTLLQSVLDNTREKLQAQITMPKLQIGTSLPRDIQFNQLFDLELDLTNSGEGIASSVVLKLEIPSDIEVVDGKPEESIPSINPGISEKRIIKLRFQTGDTSGEQIREIKGNVSYVDMLGNSHKQYFGPMELEFTAISKKEEFESTLKQSLSVFDEVTLENLNDNVLPVVLDLYKSQIVNLKDLISQNISDENFGEVNFGLKTLETLIDQAKQLTEDNELTQKFKSQLDETMGKFKEEIKQELEIDFNQQKKQAIDEINERKEKELNDKIAQLKIELDDQYSKEMNMAKEKHLEELQQANRNYEQKLNQALVQHENKLRDEFNAEKSKLVENHESVVKDMQQKHQQEIEDAKDKDESGI